MFKTTCPRSAALKSKGSRCSAAAHAMQRRWRWRHLHAAKGHAGQPVRRELRYQPIKRVGLFQVQPMPAVLKNDLPRVAPSASLRTLVPYTSTAMHVPAGEPQVV